MMTKDEILKLGKIDDEFAKVSIPLCPYHETSSTNTHDNSYLKRKAHDLVPHHSRTDAT